MKKFSIIAAVAVMVLSGCGASKSAQLAMQQQLLMQQQQLQLQQQQLQQQNQPQQQAGTAGISRQEEEIDECEKMSMDFSDGTLKAYASAINPDRDFARTTATTRARAELAASLKALVTNVIKSYRGSTTVATDQDLEENIRQIADVIAEEQMANTAVACSKRYAMGDGRYEATVCVKIVTDIKEVCKEAVKKSLAAEDKTRVEFNEDRYRESVDAELERYRQEKGY